MSNLLPWSTGSDQDLIPVPDPLFATAPPPKRPLDRTALTADENQFVLDLAAELEAAIGDTYKEMPIYAHPLSSALAARLVPLRQGLIEQKLSKLYALRGWEGVEFSGTLPTLTVNMIYHYRSRRGI